MSRRATKKDAPGLCAVFGLIMAFITLTFAYGWKLDIASKESLVRIHGQVLGIAHRNQGKGGYKIHILVSDGSRVHNLTQDGTLDDKYPAVKSVHPGDSITAFVKPDSLGRDIDWLWAIQDGEVQALTYDETLSLIMSKGRRSQQLATVTAVLSVLLLTIGLGLRMRFGAWRDTDFASGQARR